ncbi:unnamed protein product, partial [Protopolystoma xenopodis]
MVSFLIPYHRPIGAVLDALKAHRFLRFLNMRVLCTLFLLLSGINVDWPKISPVALAGSPLFIYKYAIFAFAILHCIMCSFSPPSGHDQDCLIELMLSGDSDMALVAESPDDAMAWRLALAETRQHCLSSTGTAHNPPS